MSDAHGYRGIHIEELTWTARGCTH